VVHFLGYIIGFYVHAEPRVRNGQGVARYIGRYIRHPAIADTRIVAYDGERVTFYYKNRDGAREERTVGVLEFMHGVVRHIPPKQFKMVRYFGLYAPRQAEKARALLDEIGKMLGRAIRRLNWRSRIQRDFDRDPLKCVRCGEPNMELYSLTVPSRGGMITLGGMEWLFERKSLFEIQDESDINPMSSTISVIQMRQLVLGF